MILIRNLQCITPLSTQNKTSNLFFKSETSDTHLVIPITAIKHGPYKFARQNIQQREFHNIQLSPNLCTLNFLRKHQRQPCGGNLQLMNNKHKLLFI